MSGNHDSATSQFFINVKDNLNLSESGKDNPRRDGAGYAVFGKVVAGMAVVHKIEGVKTSINNGRPNVPVETILIKKIARMTKKDAMQRIDQEKKPTKRESGTQ